MEVSEGEEKKTNGIRQKALSLGVDWSGAGMGAKEYKC